MAKYTVRVEADKTKYPVLLSNGNLIGQGDIEVCFKNLGIDVFCGLQLSFIINIMVF